MLAVLLVLVAGCGSATQMAAPSDDPRSGATTTTVTPLDGPVLATGRPDDAGVNTAVVSGTTAWVLMSGPKGAASIWRFPAGGQGTQVVTTAELNDLYPPTISIAAWSHGLIVMGERCDKPKAGECVEDSGVVQLRDHEGKLTKTLELWRNEQTQAGGSYPSFIGLDGDRAWLRSLDDIVEIDGSGDIVTRVANPLPTELCVHQGVLHQVRVDSPPLPESITPETAKEMDPATVSIQRRNGSKWAAVDNGDFTSSGPFPEVECQGDAITLWTDREPEASWTAAGGWVVLPEPAAPLSDATDRYGQTAPAIADNGAIYRLGDDFHLRRLDIPTGTLTDTGLVLEPATTNTKSFIWVTVAESGSTLFACAGRADGMPDGPTESGTVCGFAPVPT